MKLDCQMEVSGIEEIVLFRTLRFVCHSDLGGNRYWEKFAVVGDRLIATDIFFSDHKMMKKVKALARNKKMHTWVSERTLNITWRE